LQRAIKTEAVLYSKKRDLVILPLSVVAQFLEESCSYPNFLIYVEEMIKLNA